MNERRRRQLRHRYLWLTKHYDERAQQWPCGRQLAESLDSNLSMWRQEIDAIVAEVEEAMKEEVAT